MGRRLLNRLDLLTPSLGTHVEARQYSTMVSRTAHRGLRKFNAGDSVLARNFERGGKWVHGVVTVDVVLLGSRHYIVRVAGNLWKRHIDQLLRHPADVALTRGFLASDYQSTPLDVSPDMDQPYEIVPHSIIPSTYIPPTATLVVQPNSLCEYPVDTEKRYPTRTTHRPPKHLKDYELK